MGEIEHSETGDTHVRKYVTLITALAAGAEIVGGLDFRLYTGSWGTNDAWNIVAGSLCLIIAVACAVVPEVRRRS